MIERTVSGSWKIPRRTALRGLGAIASLPLLDVMRTCKASESSTNQTRLAYLYIPNGVGRGAWQAENVDSDGRLLKLNRWMQSLEPFREQLLIPTNLWTPRGNGHGAGTATWLTGGGYDGRRINVGNRSVDQIAAKHFAGQTLLPSLELSVRGEGYFSNSLARNSISWTDANTPAPRDTEPRVIFDRMFRTGRGSLSQKSVLDLVLQDARSLKQRVSESDKRKVDEYLESIRAVERRIEFSKKQQSRASQNPLLQKAIVRPSSEPPEDHQEYIRQMMDMIVLAFWSDASRVSTFMLDHGQSNRYFDFIDGVRGTWHALSHWRDISGRTEDDDGKTSWSSREEKLSMYNRVTAWHTKQVAYLLGRLQSIREADRSLLDQSMIVYGSSLGDGHEHEEKNLPLLVAGRGANAIRTGRQLDFRKPTSMSKLHLTMLRSAGIKIDEFGGEKESLES